MITFYFHHTPNPMKVALFLEESGLPYQLAPVDTLKGEQHTPAYRAINPNGKTPAIVDDGQRCLIPMPFCFICRKKRPAGRRPGIAGELLSWLMFIATGLGPYSGQSVHFRHAAPEKLPYAINRYLREAQRHYEVLNTHLEGRDYIVGDDFTIADIAAWGWIDKASVVLGEDGLAPTPICNAGSAPSMPARRWPGLVSWPHRPTSRPSWTRSPVEPCIHRITRRPNTSNKRSDERTVIPFDSMNLVTSRHWGSARDSGMLESSGCLRH
ncbi:glutathione S-transferase N-terminal domain-containing protein [Oceanimonas sp. NS1]|nr:glutathione S-transferase N-terminal domain-containing protein [Oceanimonas sp. NS1]